MSFVAAVDVDVVERTEGQGQRPDGSQPELTSTGPKLDSGPQVKVGDWDRAAAQWHSEPIGFRVGLSVVEPGLPVGPLAGSRVVSSAELAQQPANGSALSRQQVAKPSLMALVRSRGPLGLASEPNPKQRRVLARAWEQMVRSGPGCWPARAQIRESTPT